MKKLLAILMTLLFSATAHAGERLTVSDAIKFTLSANTEYLNLLDTGASSQQGRNDALNNYYNNYKSSSDGSDWLKTYATLMQYDAKIALQGSNENQKKLSLQNTLTKYFMNIIDAESSLELSKRSLDNSAAELNILKTKARLGHVSQADYNSAEADYKKAANELATKESSIAAAYTELNRLMGKPLNNRYALELEIEYSELGDVSLEQHITSAISKNPGIKQKESELEVAAYKRDQAWWVFSNSTSYDKSDLEIQVTQARRALDDSKENLRVAVTNAYNNIKDLEVQIKNNQIELDKMKEQLKVKELELQLGRTTGLDVEKYRLQIEQSEENLRQQIYNHELTVWQFMNPDIL